MASYLSGSVLVDSGFVQELIVGMDNVPTLACTKEEKRSEISQYFGRRE